MQRPLSPCPSLICLPSCLCVPRVNVIGFNSPEWFIAEMGAILAGGKAAGIYTVGVVPTSEPWVGVTNPDDLEIARRRINDLRS